MRNSLWTRLMGVFLGVIVVGVIVMVVSIRLSTAAQLRSRVLSDDVAQANALAPLLAGYYSQNGSWSGVETYLASAPQSQNLPATQMGPGMMGPGGMMENWGDWMGVTRITGPLADRVVVLDASGKVIADTGGAILGEQHPAQHTSNGVSIIMNGETVGAVLVGSMIEPVLNPADEDFLRTVNLSILITSVTVGVLALVLGSLLFRQITSPLRALSQSARAIAEGDLEQRVAVRSNDEIGQVARSFNRMAESLAEADVQRRNMMADIAHELRTPLTVVQGNLEALMDGVYDLTPENVAAVHKQTVVLTRLVGDLRDLALAEAGQLWLERKVFSLADVIAQVTEGLEVQAHEREVTLKFEVAAELPKMQADEQRITQVLFNLISNALRHTPASGTITISAELRDERILVSVRDTGTGIPPEDLPHVFERFYRADRSRARSTGGSGLGLTIAKQIIEAHGGQIWAQSWLGAGSTFAFSLPLSILASPPVISRPQHICPKCGQAAENDWLLCAYCGAELRT
ncbi:MAG: ATP-binding protein [Anaerolineales bacterium]|jgi:two-component system OmpR family sensor kinase/two-component system sensor histidine kinase BaeS|nr:ATP-binding protein [Anaerolineales bacterium]